MTSSSSERSIRKFEKDLKIGKEAKKEELIEEKPTKKSSDFVTEVLKPISIKVRLKEGLGISLAKPLTLRIKPVKLIFLRPNIRLTSITLDKPCIPKARVLTEELNDIRVFVNSPLIVETYKPLHPLIKLNPPKDISVRPLLKPKLVELAKITSSLRIVKSLNIRLILYTTPSVSSQKAICRFKLKSRLQEEIKHVITEGPSEARRIKAGRIITLKLFKKIGDIATPLGRPVCIVLEKRPNDSYVKALAIICREIYRIFKGGKPEPKYISEGLKDEIERYLRAGGMIFIVDDSKSRLLPSFSSTRLADEFWEKVNLDLLLDRLHELFSQDYGFIIFHVSRWGKEFTKILNEKTHAKVVRIRSPLWSQDVKKEIAKICWGFEEGKGVSFDDIFANSENEFNEELDKVRKNRELGIYVKEDKDASFEHEMMKRIVVECLARELGATKKDDVIELLKNRVIDTECEFSGGIADVCLNVSKGGRRFIEIETLYGRGKPDPIERLVKDTIMKYKGYSQEVEIVFLTGIPALIYARDLLRIRKIIREKYGLNVEFFLVNIKERKLIPLKEALNNLKKLIKSQREFKGYLLSEDDKKDLWEVFSRKLEEAGVNPQDPRYKRMFESLLDYSKSYEENLKLLLEEVKPILDQIRSEKSGIS